MAADAALTPPAAALAAAAEAALPTWVERHVERLVRAWQGGGPVPAPILDQARAAGERARAEVGARLRVLLAADIDHQPTNPLSVLRAATSYPTGVLRAAGVPAVRRDEFKERAFPDDVYDLSPATWADIDESVHEPGLVWSAWKAHEHLRRRRERGREYPPAAGGQE